MGLRLSAQIGQDFRLPTQPLILPRSPHWPTSAQPHTMVSMTTGISLGVLELDGRPLSLEQINLVANSSMNAAIAPAARPRIAASQAVVERIVTSNETAYGINTGFGKLSDVRISTGDLQQLQRNLVRSHACGVGEPLEEPEVRAMLLAARECTRQRIKRRPLPAG